MENNLHDNHIILACNKLGMVEHIYLDTGCLMESIVLPLGLHGLVAPASITALGQFWLAIQRKSMVADTLLTLRFEDKEMTFHFAGYLLDEMYLLCGTTEVPATEKVLEDIMSITNEQANHIRLTEKKIHSIPQADDKHELNEALLNDFSALNNELINNKRELTRKNQKIELLNKDLEAANEHMTLFTYSVSHDLREPVRMIKSFLTLLNKKYADRLDQKGQTYMNFALDGATRLSKMMADLLAYHQSAHLDTTESVDLNAVLDEVKHLLRKEIEAKNAHIIYEDLPSLKGSSTGFLQVFQNLISNAIKFVPTGRTPMITITSEANDTHYTFQVKDNGIGIPRHQWQAAFNLFKRLNTDEEYEGTGMGLAMVRKSIERMGGEVWLDSEEGVGTVVSFTVGRG